MKLNISILLCLTLIACISCAGKNQNEELQEKKAVASRQLGEAYLQTGKYTSALRELLKAEKLIPMDPVLHNDLGLVFMKKNRNDLAILHFKKAVELDPKYASAKNNLGTVWIQEGQWDKAIEILDELSGDLLYATPHYALSNIGYAYFKKGDYVRSEEYYTKSLEVKPGFVNARYGLAQIYIETGREKKAILVLKKALKQYPKTPQLLLLLGKAQAASGENANAAISFQKTIDLAPGSDTAHEAKKAMGSLPK